MSIVIGCTLGGMILGTVEGVELGFFYMADMLDQTISYSVVGFGFGLFSPITIPATIVAIVTVIALTTHHYITSTS